MKVFELKTKKREAIGKKDSAKLRKQEMVPCVMYGAGEVAHFYTHKNEFKDLVYSGDVFMVALDIDGKQYKTIMKEIQFHPVTDEILHIDFLNIDEKKPFAINLPIRFVGSAPGVLKGGRMRIRKRYVKVLGLLADMPDSFEISVAKLDVGSSIKVATLSHDKLTFLDPSDTQIAAVIVGRSVAAEEAEEGAEVDAEGEGEEKTAAEE